MKNWHWIIVAVVIFLAAWWARGQWPTALAVVPVIGS